MRIQILRLAYNNTKKKEEKNYVVNRTIITGNRWPPNSSCEKKNVRFADDFLAVVCPSVADVFNVCGIYYYCCCSWRLSRGFSATDGNNTTRVFVFTSCGHWNIARVCLRIRKRRVLFNCLVFFSRSVSAREVYDDDDATTVSRRVPGLRSVGRPAGQPTKRTKEVIHNVRFYYYYYFFFLFPLGFTIGHQSMFNARAFLRRSESKRKSLKTH